MRILQCTFEPPSVKSGGGMGIYQSGRSLCSFADVDYIGPEYGDDVIDLTYKEKYFITNSRNSFALIKNIIFSIPTSFYEDWIRTMKSIDIKQYDAVFLDFSRYDFVVKKALENDIPVYVRLHNVEQDYYNRLYNEKRSIYSWIKKTKIKKWEKYCIENARKVICLTVEDKDRILELYSGETSYEDLCIVPVCIDRKQVKMSNCKQREKTKILLTGSLWYGFNAEGTIWFLENVWPLVEDNNVELTIAGARPNFQIKSCVEKCERVTLVDTPDDITPYFEMADVYVAPIFDGAGMKVKVAEALSYGLPVLGTKHAFVGYEEIPEYMYCDSPESFANGIKKISALTEIERNEIRTNCLSVFSMNYSIKRSSNDFERIMKKDVYI